MLNNSKNQIDGGLLSHEDERQKIIQVVKAENESQKRFADADTLFGTKRWEDDWLRIYKYAATGGYLGNLISVILGFSGGIFLCYQLTSNWAAAIATGGIIVLIMEVTKSVSLREATIHILKGKGLSGVILAGIAGAMIIESAYFSVESGMKTPYFQKWVQTESATTPTLPQALNVNEYAEKIATLRSEMRTIDNERDAYMAKNKTKSANWLKADRYENVRAEIAYLQKDASTNTAEAKQAQTHIAQVNTATTLSWWYWCIVILSELCVVFGYCFRPYYLYRCRELAIIEGKTIKTEEVLVANNATKYTPQQQPLQQQLSLEQQQVLLLEIENLRQKHPNTQPLVNRALGFGESPFVNTVYTNESAINTGESTVNTVVITENTPNEMLLAAYRASNASISARKGRETETAYKQIAEHQAKQNAIQGILASRGLRIDLVGKAFQLVKILMLLLLCGFYTTAIKAQSMGKRTVKIGKDPIIYNNKVATAFSFMFDLSNSTSSVSLCKKEYL